MIDYGNLIKSCYKNFIPVRIDDAEIKRIDEFVSCIIEKKKTESHHQIDCLSERKRFTTGLMGEMAVEKLLDIEIIDWTVGESATFHHPDIPGYYVGVKTVEYGKFPIIFKRNNYAQIFCIRSIKDHNLIEVCGLATPEVLNKYQDEELILDSRLKTKGTKTGFYGFSYLSPIQCLDDIINYKK